MIMKEITAAMREGRRRPSLSRFRGGGGQGFPCRNEGGAPAPLVVRSNKRECSSVKGRNEGGAPAPLVERIWGGGEDSRARRNEGGAPAPLVVRQSTVAELPTWGPQ